VLQIADALGKMRRERAKYPAPRLLPGVYEKGGARWQVSWFSVKKKEIGQVIIATTTGRVLHSGPVSSA